MTQVRVGWRAYVSPVGGSTGTDTDAQAFITAAAITDSVQISALNTLVTDLKTYGLWTKIKALYPFVGGSAASHKFNLKDPRNLDAAYRLVFNGGWVHSSNGAKPNGTTGYADTFFIPSTNLGAYSVHLSYYSKTNRTYRNSIAIGAWQDSPTHNNIDLRLNGNNVGGNGYSVSAMFDGWDGLDYASYATTRSDYFLIGSKTAINLNKVYENGVLKATSTITSTRSLPNVRVLIGAEGRGVSGATNYDILESAFASIGDGLTDVEAANFYTSVQKFQTTLGRQVGTPYVSDPDAVAFLTAAGITDSTQAAAINTLVIRMKADGVWTKMKAIYPFVGGTANSHKWNLKDPRDLDAAYRLVFSGGWVHSSTGALPNASNTYADTKLIPNSVLTLNSTHLSFYSRTDSAIGGADFGASLTNPAMNMFTKWTDNNAYHDHYSSGSDRLTFSMSGISTSAFFISTRTSNTSLKVYRNGNQIGVTTANQNVNSLPTSSIWISAHNSNGSYSRPSNRETSFATIGDGLTDVEATSLYNAIQVYQTTLGRQVNVPLVSDTDAQAFLDAANITSFQQASAVNKLVVDLKAAGVWTKMKALYPFVGGSATSHKWNLKDPRDLDAAYRLIFTGGWVHSSTGALPNGTTAYADTKLAPSAMGQNSIHASFYSRTNTPGQIWDLGSYDAGGGVVIGVNYINNNESLVYVNVKSGSNSLPNAYPSTGLYMANRISSTTNLLYRNGTLIINGTNASFPPNNLSIYLAAYNGGTPQGYSTREQAFASIGDGLTDTEATAFYTAVQTFQTALGRAVNTPVYNNGLVLNLDAGNANSYPGTGTTWFDLAAGNNGTLVNGPTYDATSGGSLLFDGTNDYGNFGNIQSLNSLTSGVTVGAWIKTSNASGYNGIIQKWYQYGMQGGFQMFIYPNGTLGVAIGDFISPYSGLSSTTSILTGNWTYCVATYDLNSIKIYINGVLNASVSFVRSVINSNNATLYVGQDDYGSRFFRGNISSATVYSRALSVTEILNNFNSTRGRFGL